MYSFNGRVTLPDGSTFDVSGEYQDDSGGAGRSYSGYFLLPDGLKPPIGQRCQLELSPHASIGIILSGWDIARGAIRFASTAI